jgi:hypothetical protein
MTDKVRGYFNCPKIPDNLEGEELRQFLVELKENLERIFEGRVGISGDLEVGGLVNFSSSKGVNLATCTDGTDAVNKTYCDANTGSASPPGLWEIDGTETQLIIPDAIDMQTDHKIINLKDPTANQDAATKKYVDDNVFSGAHGDLTGVTSDLHHARAHTMISTSDHSADNYKLFHSDGSGEIQQLAHGATGFVLTSSGASAAPAWADPTNHTKITLTTGAELTPDGDDTITVTHSHHFVLADQSVGGTYDDLWEIDGGSTGDLLFLHASPQASSKQLKVWNGTAVSTPPAGANIIVGGISQALGNHDTMILRFDGTWWVAYSQTNNTDYGGP